MFSTLHLPALPLEALLRFRPELRLVPCAVVDHLVHDSRTTTPLLALNQLAANYHLTPGISATQALIRCPWPSIARCAKLRGPTCTLRWLPCCMHR